jgi:hypothetical protein
MSTGRSAQDNELIGLLAKLAEGDVLARVVATATMDAQGALGRVGGVRDKLGALFGPSAFQVFQETGQWPPRMVAVCDQQKDLLGAPGTKAYRQGNSLPRLLAHKTFSELVRALATQHRMRTGFVPRTIGVLLDDYPLDPPAAPVAGSWLQKIASRSALFIMKHTGSECDASNQYTKSPRI